MTTLEELRGRIDAVDDELVAVLRRRFRLTGEMRELKRNAGMAPRDEERERAVMARVMAKVEAAERDTVCGIYERIFAGSRGVIETIARGVCIRDGRVLVCRAKGAATSYLPGGHIEFGERGSEALAREMTEEAGVAVKVRKPLGVFENVFDQHGKRHAEINLVYRMELDDADVAVRSREPWIEFDWVGIDRLDAAALLPTGIRGFIRR